jgi:hypothetical protein
MNPYLLILIFILAALAAPVGIAKKSWLQFLVAMFMSFVVVVLPLFFFFVSSLMTPEWKGACHYGWVDCFIMGKLALTPFVLVATAALYRLEVLREKNPVGRWLVLGIFLGAIISTACLGFGLVCLFNRDTWMPMLVPAYVAVWYSIRAVLLVKKSTLKSDNYFWALLGTVPFWLASWFWSRQIFQSLPDNPPNCFVVTAAGCGHHNFVGPFFELEHGGATRRANQQLITLWQFEKLWRKKFPRSHQNFRRGYNWLGPMVASRIRSPWLADVMFIALKPVEWFASFCLRKNNFRQD